MSLSLRLSEYISACFTGLWVQSHEHEDALTEMAQMCRDQQWRLVVWDVNQGLTVEHELTLETPANHGGCRYCA